MKRNSLPKTSQNGSRSFTSHGQALHLGRLVHSTSIVHSWGSANGWANGWIALAPRTFCSLSLSLDVFLFAFVLSLLSLDLFDWLSGNCLSFLSLSFVSFPFLGDLSFLDVARRTASREAVQVDTTSNKHMPQKGIHPQGRSANHPISKTWKIRKSHEGEGT